MSSANLNNTLNQSETIDNYCTKFPLATIIWGVFCVPLAIVGLPICLWLLWVLLEKQRNGSFNDTFKLNLTFMDIICNMAMVMYIFNFYVFRKDVILDIFLFLCCVNDFGRPVLLAFLYADYFLAVLYPVRYMKTRHYRYRQVVCALDWVLTFVYGALTFKIMMSTLQLTAMLNTLSLTVVSACDIAIICALKKPDIASRGDTHPQKKRALQIITYSLIVVVLCCLPSVIIFLVTPLIALDQEEIQCRVHMPAYITSALSIVVIPLLQLYSLGSLKDLRRLLC